MSVIVKVFVLLVAAICIVKAQPSLTKENCLCNRVRSGLNRADTVKDIQIYPPTIFCRKVEIVVTTSKGRFCLDPSVKSVKILLLKIMKNKTTRNVSPTPLTSTTSI